MMRPSNPYLRSFDYLQTRPVLFVFFIFGVVSCAIAQQGQEDFRQEEWRSLRMVVGMFESRVGINLRCSWKRISSLRAVMLTVSDGCVRPGSVLRVMSTSGG